MNGSTHRFRPSKVLEASAQVGLGTERKVLLSVADRVGDYIQGIICGHGPTLHSDSMSLFEVDEKARVGE